MDYDKLIEELYDGAHPQNKNWKAATAIETLRADLARVTKERDAAIECLKNKCPFCRKYLTCQGRTINNDCWEFFGLKED